MKKILKFFIPVMLIIIIVLSIISIKSKGDIQKVSSQKNLNKLYNNNSYSADMPFIVSLLCFPWSLGNSYRYDNYYDYSYDSIGTTSLSKFDNINNNRDLAAADSSMSTSSLPSISSALTKRESSTKDYSTTNIQVENVDEADVNKTDGDYIYSVSDNNVIITDVKNPEKIEIIARISPSGIPEDLILYNNKLVVISSSEYTYQNSTYVDIYNIDNKATPLKVKGYQLLEPYYTSRCINNRLFVISSGYLRTENKNVISYYYENNNKKNIDFNNMYYLKDVPTNKQTLISTVDLDNPTADIGLQSYLVDISNAYVSQNNIYLLNQQGNYNYSNDFPPIYRLFSWRGAFGSFRHLYDRSYDYEYTYDSNNYYKTNIFKFNINLDGTVTYDTKNSIEGKTINQFSLDEYNGNLRVAVTDTEGSRIVVLNEKLKQIGESSWLAKGEKMYSSRFIGTRAYLVTYRTIDPLYVIDLLDPTKPTVLGELKIPGYSTYLHPYDETHLIGIGMETKENVRRDSNGKVLSTSASIVGMKMALFDVSNVYNPIQISSTVIGDNRTTSSILTNHKALLFSKEKELLAIPVNNYPEDFEISSTSDDYSTMVNSYTNYNKEYNAEGYLVYKINLTDGITTKGKIMHNLSKSRYQYGTNSRLLRGLYIDNNLYTISEDAIKVNNLDTLELVSELNLKNLISNSTLNNSTIKDIDILENQVVTNAIKEVR